MKSTIEAGDVIEIRFQDTLAIVNVLDVYDNFIRILEGFILPFTDFKLVKIIRKEEEFMNSFNKLNLKKNEEVEVEFIDYMHEDESVKFVLINLDILRLKKEKLKFVKMINGDFYFREHKINKETLVSVKKIS